MGDAGLVSPPTERLDPLFQTPDPTQAQPRDIHVLVTGFGAFKSFTNNPSYLIASALPPTLSQSSAPPPKELVDNVSTPATRGNSGSITSFFTRHLSTQSQSQSQKQQPQQQQHQSAQPLRPPNGTPYKIHIHTYPSAIVVAYASTSVLIPSLLNPATNSSVFPEYYPNGLTFDYILHIGLASGRESYTLETIAHRDDYVISDNDDADAALISEIWKREGVPESLRVGWDATDVLGRWIAEVDRREKEEVDLAEKARQIQQGVDVVAAAAEQAKNENTKADATTPTTTTTSATTTTNPGMKAWMFQHGMLLRAVGPSNPGAPAGFTAPVGDKTSLARRVKLSRDAGRFLCEFILMCSLIYRWKKEEASCNRRADEEVQVREQKQEQESKGIEEQPSSSSSSSSSSDPSTLPLSSSTPTTLRQQKRGQTPTTIPTTNPTNAGTNSNNNSSSSRNSSDSQLGKVAFLHVPNGTEPKDIARGVLVAESAIRALVASWEAGWRNPEVYPPLPPSLSTVDSSLERSVDGQAQVQRPLGEEVVVGKEGFEERGTGDGD